MIMSPAEREMAIDVLRDCVADLPEFDEGGWFLALHPERKLMSLRVQACRDQLETLSEEALGEIMGWEHWGRELEGGWQVRGHLAAMAEWLRSGRSIH